MKILIVDDSKATLEIVRRALEKFEYRRLEIKKVDNAIAALKLMVNWQPEIVLTDWHMPEMNGLEFTREIMSRDLGIKVGMITTVGEQQKVLQAKEAGASFVIVKPFNDEELHEKLLTLVRGVEQQDHMPDMEVGYSEGIALPKLTQLEKLLKTMIGAEVEIHKIRPQSFSSSKIPCLVAVFEDGENQKSRAVGLLDIYAVIILARKGAKMSDAALKAMIHDKEIEKPVIDACQKVMESAALAFLDRHTRKSLRLKTVTVFYKTFEKLEALYLTTEDKRIDFSCQIGEFAQGKVTLVGF